MRGKALDDALRNRTSRHLRLASLIEQLPEPENRVTLDPDVSDIYGVPLPRIAYRLDDYVEEGLAAARAAHAQIFARLGATDIEHGETAEGAGHIIGTARMGNDPKNAVVDRDLRSHDHRESVHPRIRRISDLRHSQSHADHRCLEPARRRPN